MASTYRTPGVYVEEIRKFPPSIAPVATAIPAFIGYTEKAEKNNENKTNIPTKIGSFPEFVEYFGGPPPRDVYIQIDGEGRFLNVRPTNQPYLMYDCIRHFYDNGGKDCFIVSVGDYETSVALGDVADPAVSPGFLVGLQALRKYDEPTLIVAPDSVNLEGFGLYSFQQQALRQCNELKDRFLICDLKVSDDSRPAFPPWEERVAEFRDRIGINNLKYGAAYYPWLKAQLQINLGFREVLFTMDDITVPGFALTPGESLTNLLTLTNDDGITQLLYDLNNSGNAVDSFTDDSNAFTAFNPLSNGAESLVEGLNTAYNGFFLTYNDSANITYVAFSPNLPNLYQWIRNLLLTIRDIRESFPTVQNILAAPNPNMTIEFRLRNDIDNLLPEIRPVFNALVAHHLEIASTSTNGLLLFDTIAAELTNFNDTRDFLEYPPAVTGLSTFPQNAEQYNLNVHHQYWAISARNLALVSVSQIATNGAATPQDLVDNLLPSSSLREDTSQLIEDEVNVPAADLDAVFSSLDGGVVGDETNAARRVAISYIDSIRSTILDGTDDPNDPAIDFISNYLPIPTVIINEVLTTWNDLHQVAQAAANAGGSVADAVNDEIPLIIDPGNVVRENIRIAGQGALNGGRQIINMFSSILSLAESYETTFDESLRDSFGTYKQLLTKAAQEISLIPPGCTMAGIYAAVDRDRGVWKAPANVSVASVNAPSVVISVEDQEGLNIDPGSGKSINAIRAFTGKGILVWGTRTLAGNDSEWRYVPVKRFFIFAEESIKKATEQFVFEPNDANTWVRIKAMIENFLLQQWRAGALAGATPKEAFRVSVGLGETMTATDILDGNMIVEVAMAVVRPAEFIILRFMHKMQES